VNTNTNPNRSIPGNTNTNSNQIEKNKNKLQSFPLHNGTPGVRMFDWILMCRTVPWTGLILFPGTHLHSVPPACAYFSRAHLGSRPMGTAGDLRPPLLASGWTAAQSAPVRLVPVSHAHHVPVAAPRSFPRTPPLSPRWRDSRASPQLAITAPSPRCLGHAPITHCAPVKHLQHETLGCNIRWT
jgi:hypothetical protein